MTEATRITHPDQLRELYRTRLSHFNNDASEPSSELVSQTQQVKLVLLQPLANVDILEACRDLGSRQIRNSNGLLCPISNHEYLDIQSLSKAWRQAFTKIPPIPRLIFDLVLPKEDEKSKGLFQRIYWDTAMPQEDSIGVRARNVMSLAITIATEMRMRSNVDVSFEVIYDEMEGVSLKGMALLKKQLLALSKTKISKFEDRAAGYKDQDNIE
ncbi:hypothetical protein BGW36DRAFT_380378 [Talaromyces proteolyticus]|uniref:Uncharacterized protein n=1 Tax=Talaromyces proteolyticus TaxID=1131652 RepID=A0AAD4KQM8_9EURO|nr:uncharacterized protein BGW36DRAFT_380378 [Talaromyces proteolyticus]KAH8696167.1 hypothetical protein BGW36DRAFT_380378 [Talaromyces proteolyticus]